MVHRGETEKLRQFLKENPSVLENKSEDKVDMPLLAVAIDVCDKQIVQMLLEEFKCDLMEEWFQLKVNTDNTSVISKHFNVFLYTVCVAPFSMIRFVSQYVDDKKRLVNWSNQFGETSLHFAYTIGGTQGNLIVSYLVEECGANEHALTVAGEKPSDYLVCEMMKQMSTEQKDDDYNNTDFINDIEEGATPAKKHRGTCTTPDSGEEAQTE